MVSKVLPKKITDEEIPQLRQEKVDLNRHSRRQTGMKKACKGKTDGVLECQTPEGSCPDFDICHEKIGKTSDSE